MATSCEECVRNKTLVMGSCVYNRELHIISIENSSSLDELYGSIADKWSCINPRLFTLRYKPPHSNYHYVTLRNDKDVKNMIQLHLLVKSPIVNIAVDENDLSKGPVNDEAGGRGKKRPIIF